MKEFDTYFKPLYAWLTKYYWVIFILLSVFIFRKITIILLFIVLAALPQSYKRAFPFPLGIEFLTFFTVVIAYWLGPFIAWLCTFPMVLLSMFFSGNASLPKYRFVKYALICLFIFVLANLGTNIVAAGRLTTVVVNFIGIVMAGMIAGARSIRTLPAKVINILLNFYLFAHFGQWLVNMLNYL